VSDAEPADVAPILADPAARRQFEKLTQELVDIAIEIIDLQSGDPDIEANGDEFEEADPTEDSEGI
jgi:hypothetical protein